MTKPPVLKPKEVVSIITKDIGLTLDEFIQVRN
jgi:hypothetical protein